MPSRRTCTTITRARPTPRRPRANPMALDANGHPVSRIAQRKLEHLRLSLEASVQSTRGAGFERFAFTHQALPELDLDAIDTRTSFMGKPLKLPFLISSMTGGAQAAGDINRRLALVAQTVGIAFGVGSQRAGLTHKDLRPTYQVRSVAPDVLLFANLGAVQLNYGMRTEQCLEAIEMIGADALILHLNPLQEALQPEGDHNFKGLTSSRPRCRQSDRTGAGPHGLRPRRSRRGVGRRRAGPPPARRLRLAASGCHVLRRRTGHRRPACQPTHGNPLIG